MEKVKNYFLQGIIGILVLVIFFQMCGGNGSKTPAAPKIDTVRIVDVIEKHDTVKGDPVLIQSKPTVKWRDSIKYLPDTNYAKLLAQYNWLLDKFFTINIYSDSLKIDSVGYVFVKDTIHQNRLIGSSFVYSLNYPVKTNIITIREPYVPKRQLFIGGGIDGNKINFINAFNVGFLFKDKKDHLYGGKAGLNYEGVPFYGVHAYWKLSFK